MARKFVCLSIMVLAGALSLNSQAPGRGTLKITVCDQVGAVIPRAAITVRGTDAQQAIETTTNESGNANIEPAPGAYELSVGSRGFAKATRTVAVSEVENPRMAIILHVGASDSSGTVFVSVPPLLPDAKSSPDPGRRPLKITVYDQSGAAIPRTRLTLSQIGTTSVLETNTDEKGVAELNLPFGTYRVSVERGGFLTWAGTADVGCAPHPNLEVTLKIEPLDYYGGMVIADFRELVPEAPTLSAWIPEESVTQLTSLPARKFRRNR